MRNGKLDLSQGQHRQLKGAQAGETILLGEGKDAWLTTLHLKPLQFSGSFHRYQTSLGCPKCVRDDLGPRGKELGQAL